MKPATNVDEAMELAMRLRDALGRSGHADAALRLHDVITGFWTTTSEALVELLNALEDTRKAWERSLTSEDAKLGDVLVSSARDLLRFE